VPQSEADVDTRGDGLGTVLRRGPSLSLPDYYYYYYYYYRCCCCCCRRRRRCCCCCYYYYYYRLLPATYLIPTTYYLQPTTYCCYCCYYYYYYYHSELPSLLTAEEYLHHGSRLRHLLRGDAQPAQQRAALETGRARLGSTRTRSTPAVVLVACAACVG